MFNDKLKPLELRISNLETKYVEVYLFCCGKQQQQQIKCKYAC